MSPQVQDEARRLFVSLLDRPSAAKRAEVAAWRQADPAHDAALVAIEASWLATGQAAQRIAQDDTAELGVYLDAMDRAKSRKNAIALSLTVALGLFLWLQHPHLIQNLQADHVAARATREQVTLPDGSSVLLDADSAFSVRFSADERRVSLLLGAAFFEVKPSDVPFVVEAGGGTIRVLGTGFDVRLLDDGASVTLEHGSIALTSGKDATPVILVAGEQADFGAQGVDVGSVVLADALAWRAGRYVFTAPAFPTWSTRSGGIATDAS